MRIHHIRNATLLLSLGEHRILVDPMLAQAGTYPGFKMFGGGRKNNPLVDLPSNTEELLQTVTDVLITHEHLDHLDAAAHDWIQGHDLPVWAGSQDVASLHKKGFAVQEFKDGSLGCSVEMIPAQHGHGLLGWLMGPVHGFYIAHPGEPSLYIISDSVWNPRIGEAIERLQPELIVAPAGSANLGKGKDILFSFEELIHLARIAPNSILFNHLEALDHCPTTRTGLRERLRTEGLEEKVYIPQDGDSIYLEQNVPHSTAIRKHVRTPKPGFQKWVSSKL